MPIFEYRCTSCNQKFDILHKTLASAESVACPKCQTTEVKKLMSTFMPTFASASYSSPDSCSNGSCDANIGGGCANGMCGLN